MVRQGESSLEGEVRDPGLGREGGVESTCRCGCRCRCRYRCRCRGRCRCMYRFRCTLARQEEDCLEGEVRGPWLGREGGAESACRCRVKV